MITGFTNQSYEVVTTGWPTGQALTFSYRIRDNAGVDVVPPTGGILEDLIGSGTYRTTIVLPDTAGQYALYWSDDGTFTEGHIAVEEIQVNAIPFSVGTGGGIPVESFIPTTQQVAQYIMARTRDRDGQFVGDFTADTIPTHDQVMALMADVSNDVAALIDTDISPESYESVRALVALGTAMRIELSFFPEAVGLANSSYDRLERMFNAMLTRVQTGVEREIRETTEGTERSYGVLYNFPSPSNILSRKM